MRISEQPRRMLIGMVTTLLLLSSPLISGCISQRGHLRDDTVGRLIKQGMSDYDVRREPKPEKDHLLLARELMARKMYAVALGRLAEASGSGAAMYDIEYLKGRCYLGLSDYGKAVEAFQRALVLNGSHAPSYGGLGLAYDLSNRRGLAWKAYEKAIEIDPAIADFQINIGFSKLAAGNYKEAEAYFLKSLAIECDSAVARNNLAFAYALQGRYDKAMELLTQQDTRASALSNLGVFYELAGDFANAVRCYRLALAEDGNLKEARENLAALGTINR